MAKPAPTPARDPFQSQIEKTQSILAPLIAEIENAIGTTFLTPASRHFGSAICGIHTLLDQAAGALRQLARKPKYARPHPHYTDAIGAFQELAESTRHLLALVTASTACDPPQARLAGHWAAELELIAAAVNELEELAIEERLAVHGGFPEGAKPLSPAEVSRYLRPSH